MSRLKIELAAGGTGSVNDARPASTVSADAMLNETANAPGPSITVAVALPSWSSGRGLGVGWASVMVSPAVSGTLVSPFCKTSPSISSAPTTESVSRRSLKAARDSTYGSGAASAGFGRCAARSSRRLYSASVKVTVPGALCGTTRCGGRLCSWPRATMAKNVSTITNRFIAHLAFSHAENQLQEPAIDSRWSAPTPEKLTGRNVERRPAQADCAAGG